MNKTHKVDGKTYTIQPLSMEDGFELMNSGPGGGVDMAGIIRASTLIDGKPAKPKQIPLKVANMIMNDVLEANGMDSDDDDDDVDEGVVSDAGDDGEPDEPKVNGAASGNVASG